MSSRTFLDNAYDLPDAAATQSFYDDWAASYDAEIAANGYATPARCAEALAAVVDTSSPVLDIGCGTGLSGLALRAHGFTTIDGTDLSPEMLTRASERTGVYRRLFLSDMNTPLPVEAGAYMAATAVGVINPGHAPPETVDAVLAILPVGGCFAFSLNDHALAEPSFPAKVDQILDKGAATCLHRAHGPHLPGIGLEATVYVIQKS